MYMLTAKVVRRVHACFVYTIIPGHMLLVDVNCIQYPINDVSVSIDQ